MKKFTNLFREMPKGNISKILTDRITDELIQGNLRPGDKLPTEVEFAENLGVGRNSVREAMKVLEAFGVIEIRRAEGTFVSSEFNQKMLDPLFYGLIMSNPMNEDMLEFKIVFINAILFCAMDRVTGEDIRRLQEICDRFKKNMEASKPDADALLADSQTFLRIIGGISGNVCIEQFSDILLKLTKYMCMEAIANSVKRDDRISMWKGYQEIVDLLRTRDRAGMYDYTKKTFSAWKRLM